eukprot:2717137-Pyramimonas_sp.AAC.1
MVDIKDKHQRRVRGPWMGQPTTSVSERPFTVSPNLRSRSPRWLIAIGSTLKSPAGTGRASTARAPPAAAPGTGASGGAAAGPGGT